MNPYQGDGPNRKRITSENEEVSIMEKLLGAQAEQQAAIIMISGQTIVETMDSTNSRGQRVLHVKFENGSELALIGNFQATYRATAAHQLVHFDIVEGEAEDVTDEHEQLTTGDGR